MKNGQVKLKISQGTREAKFSLGEGKKSTGLGFTGSVTEGCLAAQHDYFIHKMVKCVITITAKFPSKHSRAMLLTAQTLIEEMDVRFYPCSVHFERTMSFLFTQHKTSRKNV